mmetsp:Transcript_35018/g.99255  ORF Transcript_35018/g.99255 Transcript_35018/m.99255 type:complete len:274 (+) Transcript_35018:313-1134(+)
MGRPFGELVVRNATEAHTATLIVLHGLGDTGHGWYQAASQIKLGPHVKFLFPTAPTRPITLNMGMEMPGWFDIKALGDPQQMLQQMGSADGMQESLDYVRGLIEKEISYGIAPERIVVAGFSQGGHLALKTVLQSPVRLGGCVAMSTWLEPFSFEVSAAKEVPFLVCHGSQDPLIPSFLSSTTEGLLKAAGVNVTLKMYPGMQHSTCPQEMNDFTQFVSPLIPAEAPPPVSKDDVGRMSIKELKAFLSRHGADTRGLLEKADFVDKAKELCES